MTWELVAHDLRQAARWLLRRRRMSLLAVLTIALGIGPCAAVFSIVNAVVLRPLPFEQPDRLFCLWMNPPEGGRDRLSLPDADDLKTRCQSFEAMTYYFTGNYEVVSEEYTEELATISASPNVFKVLGIAPEFGRGFEPGDENPDGEKVALLSHELWQRWFGADPGVLGTSLNIRGVEHTVIGVLPDHTDMLPTIDARFVRFPIWTTMAPRTIPRRFGFVHMVGRMRNDRSFEQARAEVNAVALQLEQEHPQTNTGRRFSLTPIQSELLGSLARGLVLALAAVGLVVLIAISNVANLLLTEGAARRREIVLRRAVGASNARIARRLLFESLLLAIAGGLLGLIAGTWAVKALIAMAPPGVPRLDEVTVDAHVALFSLAVAVMAGLVAGLVPAVDQLRVRDASAVDNRTWIAAAGLGGRTASELIVVLQVALAVVLLVGTGLMVKSFDKLLAVDPGFEAESVLAVRMRVPRSDSAAVMTEQIKQHLEALPGVREFGTISYLPFVHPGWEVSYESGEDGSAGQQKERQAYIQTVTPGFFKAMGIQLIEGRFLTQDDVKPVTDSVIVSRSIAEELWPGQSALGRPFIRHNVVDPVPLEVIGVVSDTHQRSLDSPAVPTIYIPFARDGHFATFAVVRTDGDPDRFAAIVRDSLLEFHKSLTVSYVAPLSNFVLDSIAAPRFVRWLLGVLSALALGLALVGTYGVMSCTVAARTPEIGVRMSVGASPVDVIRLQLARGVRLALAGVGVGILSAFLLTRFLASLVFETSTTDPRSFAISGALMFVATLLACLPPALRASRIDPVIALREE